MKNSTLLMVGIVAVISMQSAGLAVLPTTVQQASAQDTNFDFEQDQENRCSGFSNCFNQGCLIGVVYGVQATNAPLPCAD
jgi:predicted phage tail protein